MAWLKNTTVNLHFEHVQVKGNTIETVLMLKVVAIRNIKEEPGNVTTRFISDLRVLLFASAVQQVPADMRTLYVDRPGFLLVLSAKSGISCRRLNCCCLWEMF